MKKLLTILGAFTISASSATLVIACSTETETKYGEVFIDANGNLKIDANDLVNWYKDTYGSLGKDPNKFIADFYNIFAISIFEDLTIKNDSGEYVDSALAKKIDANSLAEIRKSWGDETTVGSIRYQAKVAMEAARKKYLDDSAQKLSGWLKYLRGQFPAVIDTQATLEKAWISNFILTDSDYSAYKSLTKILAFNGMSTSTKWTKGTQNYLLTNSNNSTQHAFLLNQFKQQFGTNTLNELTGNISATPNLTPEKELSIINLINAIGGKNAIKTQDTGTADSFSVEYISSIGDITWEQFFQSFSYRYKNKDISEQQKSVPINTLTEFMTSTDLTSLGLNGVIDSNFINYNVEKPNNLTQIVNYIPTFTINNDDNSLQAKQNDPLSDGRLGILTASQRFLSQQYFATKKPVAVSDVVLKFAGTADLNKEISVNLFVNGESDSNTLTTYFKGFQAFYDSILTNTSVNPQTGLSLFESFYRGANSGNLVLNGDEGSWATTYLTSQNDKGLLTVDNTSYSNVAKYAIYDFINGGSGATTTPTGENTWDNASTNIPESTLKDKGDIFSTEDGADTLFNLVKATNRIGDSDSSQENVYTIVNQDLGIISFIDTDGLHFSKIDGYALMQDSQTSDTSSITEQQESLAYDQIFSLGNNYSSYIINSETYISSDSANKDATWDTKNNEVQKNIKNMQLLPQVQGTINYQITNSYERFLVNNSLVKTLNSANALYNFDYLSDLTSALSNSGGTFSDLGQWLWSYLRALLEVDDAQLFSMFFTTADDANLDTAAIEELVGQIQIIEQVNSAAKVDAFNNQNNTWNKEVANNYTKQLQDLSNDEQAKKFIPNQALKANYGDSFMQSNIWNDYEEQTISILHWTQSLNTSLQFIFTYEKVTINHKGDE